MFIVFAWDKFSYLTIGRGDTVEDAWGDLLGANDMDEDDIHTLEWFRAESVKVSQKTVFKVED